MVKKRIAMLMAAIPMFVMPLFADEWLEESTGITWQYTLYNHDDDLGYSEQPFLEITSAFIKKYLSGYSDDDFVTLWVDGDLVIPDEINGIPVTRIGQGAFAGNPGLASVTFGYWSPVRSIGDSAFRKCTNLQSVSLPGGLCHIGSLAFNRCHEELFDTVTIPGVKLLNGWVVESDESLSGFLNLADTYGLADGAFNGRSGLTGVTLPEVMEALGDYTFGGCSGLVSLTIPSGVKRIGNRAFSGCEKLSGTLSLPSGLQFIRDWAFSECKGLICVTIPDSVINIASSAFSGCESMRSFVVGSENEQYKSVSGLLLSKDGEMLVAGVNGDVTLPDSVTWIADYAFAGRTGLRSVAIPECTTYIGMYAFCDCRSLPSVTIPENLLSIQMYAFSQCTSLREIHFKGNSPDIGEFAFDCTSCEVYVKRGSTGWGVEIPGIWKDRLIFYEDAPAITITVTYDANGGDVTPEPVSIESGSAIGSLPTTTRDGYTFIGWWTSADGSGTQISSSTIVNETVTYYARWEEDIQFAYTVTYDPGMYGIGSVWAEEATQGETLRLADYAAFTRSGYTQTGWSTDYFGSTKDYDFGATYTANASITLYPYWTANGGDSGGEDPPVTYTVTYHPGACGSGIQQTATKKHGETLWLPEALFSREGYTQTGWSLNYDGSTKDYYLIDWYTGDASVTFYPYWTKDEEVIHTADVDGVTWRYVVTNGEAMIFGGKYQVWDDLEGDYTWEYIPAISQSTAGALTVPSSLGGYPVTAIGGGAFNTCSEITSVAIPNGVTLIGDDAFRFCHALTSVSLPAGLLSIGKEAFESCPLASLELPQSVTTIGERAFGACYSLTDAYVPGHLLEVIENNDVFAYNSGVTIHPTDSGSGGDDASPDTIYTETVGGVAWRYVVVNGEAVVFGGKQLEWDDEEEDYTWEYTPSIPRGTSGAISIPSSLGGYPVTAVGDGAFTECEGLTSVTIPYGVTAIGEDAFSDCVRLTYVALPEGLLSIGKEAFESCALMSLDLPQSLTAIGEKAFGDCANLRRVVIPVGVSSLGYRAFQRCYLLQEAYVPPHLLATVGTNEVFRGTPVKVYGGGEDGTPPPVLLLPWTAKAAVTLRGVVYDSGQDVAGIVEIKVGKPNAKKRNVKVSGSVTLMDGKKRTFKALAVPCDGSSTLRVDRFTAKGLGAFSLEIGSNGFSGGNGSYSVADAEVGGRWTREASVYGDWTDAGNRPAGTLTELLPDEEALKASGGKWVFAKPAKVKYGKRKEGGIGLTLDTAGGKTNRSAMKLTYAPKTGVFKGSFKIYAVQGGKLKRFTVKVTGFVVDGTGFGLATLAKPRTTWWLQVD